MTAKKQNIPRIINPCMTRRTNGKTRQSVSINHSLRSSRERIVFFKLKNKLTLNLYLYTRYAPPAAIARPIKITQTAVQADRPLDALPTKWIWNVSEEQPPNSHQPPPIQWSNLVSFGTFKVPFPSRNSYFITRMCFGCLRLKNKWHALWLNTVQISCNSPSPPLTDFTFRAFPQGF